MDLHGHRMLSAVHLELEDGFTDAQLNDSMEHGMKHVIVTWVFSMFDWREWMMKAAQSLVTNAGRGGTASDALAAGRDKQLTD